MIVLRQKLVSGRPLRRASAAIALWVTVGVAQVTRQIGFRRSADRGQERHFGPLDGDIRRYTLSLYRAAAGGVIKGRGQLYGPGFADGNHGLHRPLTEASGAQREGTALVLERGGLSVGSGGRAFIDQCDNGR